MERLTIEKLPTSVPPVVCCYADMEEAVYRIGVEDEQHKYVICREHMRKYLLEVADKLSEET